MLVRGVNSLRKLIDSGQLTEADLADMTLSGTVGADPAARPPSQNALARFLSEQEQFAANPGRDLPMNSMRNEATGAVTYFGPQGGFSDSPYPNQPGRQQQPRMRLAGYGNGTFTDLGEDGEPPRPLDMSRGPIEIPGAGRGYYTRDGRSAVVTAPDGSKVRVILGYDREGSMRATAQDLALQRARAELDQTNEAIAASRDARTRRESPEVIPGAGYSQALLEKQFGRAPEGKRWNSQGQLEEIPGSDGGKMTESQAKALGFGMRAANSHEILDTVGQDGAVQPSLVKRAAEGVPLVGGALGMAANALPEALGGPSAAQQQVEQAQRDFINAILRRESGAVISPSEFQNAAQQYFPQPGDSREVIAQKKRNRELQIKSFGEEVGGRRRLIDDAGQQARTAFGQRQAQSAFKGQVLSEAFQAVRSGKNRAMIRERLISMGINPAEAGL